MRAPVSTWWTYCSSSVRQRQQRGGVVADDDVERWSAGAASAALVVQHDGQQALRKVGEPICALTHFLRGPDARNSTIIDQHFR